MSGLIVIHATTLQARLVGRRLGYRACPLGGTVFHLRDEAMSPHLGQRKGDLFVMAPAFLDDIAGVDRPCGAFVTDLRHRQPLDDALRRGLLLPVTPLKAAGLRIDRERLLVSA